MANYMHSNVKLGVILQTVPLLPKVLVLIYASYSSIILYAFERLLFSKYASII